MAEIRVAVTQLEYDKAPAVFAQPPYPGMTCFAAPAAETRLAAAISEQDAGHAVLGIAPYRQALYANLPRGGVLARLGTGIDGLDLATASRHGILCTNAPGVVDQSVAEFTIALLLAAARGLPDLAQQTRTGKWQPRMGREVAGGTLALIGCGGIGSRVARIAAHGLGMRVIGCKRSLNNAAELKQQWGFSSVVQDPLEAVSEADFISLHLPLNQDTRHFVGAVLLAQVPATAWLINTSRGGIIDERALYQTLANGRLAGAAIDVTAKEPYTPIDPEHDLRQLPNVLLTPHAASTTRQACEATATRCLRNIWLAEQKDYEQMDLLNPEVLAD